MGVSSSKTRRVNNISNKRIDRIYIRNGVPPIRLGNGIEADGRSVYSDKPRRRTYNIPLRKNIQNM